MRRAIRLRQLCAATALGLLAWLGWQWGFPDKHTSVRGAERVQHISFSEAETAWMARKGVLRFTIDPSWAPLEFVEDGKPHGLIVHYLEALAQRVPMRFEFVPTDSWHDAIHCFSDGEIDLLPGSTLGEHERDVLGDLLQIVPYYVGSTLIVSRPDHPVVLEFANLAGLRVAVADDDDAEAVLRARVPGIQLTSYLTPGELLEAVVNGQVDVAVAPELILSPLMSRFYRGRLASAGVLEDMPVVQRMGVNKDAHMLKAILDRAMLSLTAGETDDIVADWQATIDYGRISPDVIWRQYKTELALVILAMLLLASLMMFAFHLRRQAQRSAVRKLRFLTTVSHEIRNAMNAVVGPLEVLAHESVPARRQEMIDTARDGARVLLETVNSLLDLSTLRARKARVDAQPTQVSAVVDDVIRLLRPGVCAAIALESDVRVDRWVVIDGAKYRQVLMNLLSNAIKFTDQGEIIVRVQVLRKKQHMWLLTRVSDSGAGIAPDRLKAIFEAYTQGHDETTLMQANNRSTRRGTGLGLTICSELVGLQGGRMWAESLPGRGSDFYFELPVELVDRQDVAVDATVDATDATGHRSTARVAGTGAHVGSHPGSHAGVHGGSRAGMQGGSRAGAHARSHAGVHSGSHAGVHTPPGARGGVGSYADAGNVPDGTGIAAISAVPPSAGAYRPVLVVDDNPVNLTVLRKQLEVLACPVTACVSSQEALEIWRQGQFGLVLLDCNMPDLDGYALAALIRKEEKQYAGGRTPIVAVSAMNDSAHRQRCVASGMDEVIVKPVQLDQLRQVLQTWLALEEPAAPTADPFDDAAIAQVFIQTNADDLAAIRVALAARDAQALAQRAHRVSGAAAVMAEENLAACAAQLERLSQASPHVWDDISRVSERLAAAMADYASRNA